MSGRLPANYDQVRGEGSDTPFLFFIFQTKPKERQVNMENQLSLVGQINQAIRRLQTDLDRLEEAKKKKKQELRQHRRALKILAGDDQH